MTDRPFDLERALPPLVSCPAAPFSLSLSISPSRFPPPSRNSLENLSGGTDAAKINPKRAQKKSDPPPVFADLLDLSDLLRYFPSLSPLVKWNDTCTTTDPIVLCPLPLPPARSQPRKRGFKAIVRVLASLSALNRFPIVLCLLSCCASARFPPSFLSCKIHKTQILPPKKERKKLSNTIKGISRRKGEEKQKNFSSL